MENNNHPKYTHAWFINRFESTKEDAKKLILPLDEALFTKRPAAGEWCVGECISHLIETGQLYLESIKKGTARASGEHQHNENGMHLRFYMKWFVHYLEPPVSIKTKNPGSFQPAPHANINKQDMLTGFLNLQDKYLKQLENAQSKNLALSTIKVPNPVISFIKMTVAECIAITEAHQRRHLWQAEQTLTHIQK